jgi:hypothetical protein
MQNLFGNFRTKSVETSKCTLILNTLTIAVKGYVSGVNVSDKMVLAFREWSKTYTKPVESDKNGMKVEDCLILGDDDWVPVEKKGVFKRTFEKYTYA